MDKSWIHESRASPAFKLGGVSEFLKFAFENSTNDGRLKCPCKKCSNRYRHNRDTIYEHMICFGVGTDYLSNKWIYHGELKKRQTTVNNEGVNETGNMHDMLHDVFRIPNDDVSDHDSGPDDMMGECNKVSNHDAQTFYKPLEDAEQELYPGCKRFIKFFFIVRLFHIKCLNGLSDKAVIMLLELIKEALLEWETLPKSFYHAKKISGGLGLGYKKIDACPNDCMLCWKENEHDSSCSICGASRWKPTSDDLGYNNLNQSSATTRRVPAKVLHHFPLKPRL
ncbi:uncharacterized protein LOC107175499 [Citrus sinensis]|uniref:uncharacterized protein LOC107175499 n=1 Tax=Citrus sinensis TaxID=2711 RepID=UPI000763776F|nr:uncharacterized protein LOC107175499 [Citrus sinensis]XP_024039311.1 uncharacterized protein LOC112097949 [Citrus x clementina]